MNVIFTKTMSEVLFSLIYTKFLRWEITYTNVFKILSTSVNFHKEYVDKNPIDYDDYIPLAVYAFKTEQCRPKFCETRDLR